MWFSAKSACLDLLESCVVKGVFSLESCLLSLKDAVDGRGVTNINHVGKVSTVLYPLTLSSCMPS